MPIVECQVCGNEFYATPKRIEQSKWKLFCCSRECAIKFRIGKKIGNRKGEDRTCEWCGKVSYFTTDKLKRQEHFYCSVSCWLNGRKRYQKKTFIVKCVFCNKDFDAQEYSYRKQKYGYFCSRKCYGKWRSENLRLENSPNWKGGDKTGYGYSDWKAARAKALERDGNKCIKCGIIGNGRNLDVHHKRAYNFNMSLVERKDANKLENLVTLCRKCHMDEHLIYDKENLRKSSKVSSVKQ